MVFGMSITHLLHPECCGIKNFYRNSKGMELRVNSLQGGEQVCLFCLETIKDGEAIANPIGCQCQLSTHQRCLRAWFDQKHQMECPICHIVSTPSPFQFSDDYRIIQIIHVDSSPAVRERQHIYRHDKAMAFCCCLLLGWAVGLTILEYATT
jgi:hypothetical protein